MMKRCKDAYLGNFEYDTELWRIESGVLPTLSWIGEERPVILPEGLRCVKFMFRGCTSKLDLSMVDITPFDDLGYMFNGYLGTELDLTSFDTSGVKTMDFMFAGCSFLKRIDISDWVIKGCNLRHMFYNCINLECLDLSSVQSTDSQWNKAFEGCYGLDTIDLTNISPQELKTILYCLLERDTGLHENFTLSVNFMLADVRKGFTVYKRRSTKILW